MRKTTKTTMLKRLRVLDEERAKIMIALNQTNIQTPKANIPVSSPFSLQGRVVNSVIRLIKKEKKSVTSQQILTHLKKTGFDLGHYPAMMLAAILGQEVNKKSARLVRVARGLYDLHTNEMYIHQ